MDAVLVPESALAAEPNRGTVAAASRLLRVTEMGRKFDSIATQQSRDIVRTYASIVSMSADVELPAHIRQSIRSCYSEVYAWKNFVGGIAEVFAAHLSDKELGLLIDFYQNRGLPPMEIPTFKQIISKANKIEQGSLDYIYGNSEGCLERDVEIIMGYLASDQAKPNRNLVAE